MGRPICFPAGNERLSSALLSDALDQAGIYNQAMGPEIRPLDGALQLCGRARTGMYIEVAQVTEGRNPYELEIELVDQLEAGDVAVLACGGSRKIAPWGGLLSTASHVKGGAGCITDGFVRDTKQIRALAFPVFHGGIAPLDSRGRGEVREIDVPVICAGVRVAPGDLVFGDCDGVVVVPQAFEDVVFAYAMAKLQGEIDTLSELRSGKSLRDVFARYGIL